MKSQKRMSEIGIFKDRRYSFWYDMTESIQFQLFFNSIVKKGDFFFDQGSEGIR